MNIDKICNAAKAIISVVEELELSQDEASQASQLANAELNNRYMETLRREADLNLKQNQAPEMPL